jgi:hypothetical protein
LLALNVVISLREMIPLAEREGYTGAEPGWLGYILARAAVLSFDVNYVR